MRGGTFTPPGFGEAHPRDTSAAAPRFAWPAEMVRLYQNEGPSAPSGKSPGRPTWPSTCGAEGGGLASMTRLGVRYREGRGVERDPAVALRWFRAAAETGDPEALTTSDGCWRWASVARPTPAAIRAYRQAAEGRSHQARFNLGRVLLEGGAPGSRSPHGRHVARARRHGAARGAAALLRAWTRRCSTPAAAQARRLALAWR